MLPPRGPEVDGILADLGVSSHHFDAPWSAASRSAGTPLDMRMNQRGRLTAADVVNGYSAEELDAPRAGRLGASLETPWKVASCLVRAREAGAGPHDRAAVAARRALHAPQGRGEVLTKSSSRPCGSR